MDSGTYVWNIMYNMGNMLLISAVTRNASVALFYGHFIFLLLYISNAGNIKRVPTI